jgi:two-component system chemotaxis response regulator CheB
MTRVLVVDDSPTVQDLLIHIFESDPEIEIAGVAADGEEAVRMAQLKKPDVITMDLQMPNVDGFEATRTIMQTCPTPIVIVSGSDDPAEVNASFRAIQAGALVMVKRPPGVGHPEHLEHAIALIRMVKTMAEVKVVRRWPRDGEKRRAVAPAAAAPKKSSQERSLVLLGASTGGPAALRDILAQLPANFRLPIVIVQHMSAGFVQGLAEWLSATTGFAVSVANHGESLIGGRAYVVPDGCQPAITRDLHIALLAGPPEHGMRPAVSHLFRMTHADVRANTVAVLLTGMGKDGAAELKQLKDDGAITIVQDRASSAVYGMPGEAILLDAAMLILEPVKIGKTLYAISTNPAIALHAIGV